MRLIAPATFAALVFLAACSPMREPVVIEKAVAATAEPSAGLAGDPACLPGDDGIGGTGCELD